MEEASYSMTESAFRHDQSGPDPLDKGLAVKFKMHPRLDPEKSKEAGRPIYVDTPYVEIMTPGNKNNIPFHRVEEKVKRRFPEQWRQFLASEEQIIEGTPLEEWPGISRSQVEELRYMNVRTIEQLVSMSDGNAAGMMGVVALRQKAQAYLEASEKNAAAERVIEQENEIRALKEQMAQLMADAPKKRGRPAKTESEED